MSSYSIIEADIHHNQDDIFPILEKNLGGFSPERYAWNYKQCPYGAAHCWLARHEPSKTFIGTAALFPRVITVKGKPVYAAIAGDFAVDKNHRNLRPALALQNEIKSKIRSTGFKFIYSLPNEQSKGIFIRMGYKKMGEFTRFVKPLKSEYKSHQYLQSFLEIKMLAGIADIFIKWLSKEKYYKTTLKYSIEIPDTFDDRFDEFWNNLPKHSVVIGERTSAFLNWRYMQSPEKKYKIFCILDEQTKIIGYTVYFLEHNMCHISDMVYEPEAEILSLLLAEFSRFIRMEGVGSISIYYLGNSSFEKKLREFNFMPIESEMNDILIYSPDTTENADILNRENWYFFAGDNDF